MQMKRIAQIGLLFMIIGIFTGCSSDKENTSQQTGKLIVNLTDAPFPYDQVAEANVTIFKIDARMVGEETAGSDTMGDGSMIDESGNTSPFLVLMENEIPVNLLDLSNGITTELAETDVPAGSYDLVRVYVKGINVVLKDGATYNLKIPSGEQTGIKVFIRPNLVVVGGLTSDLLLDFDVSRSFVAKGSASSLGGILGFNFKPVIKASNSTIAGTLAGTVSGIQEDESLLGLEGAEVSVYVADTLNTTTFTDADGHYMVQGLLEGTYAVEVDADGYEPGSAEDIDIVAGNLTTLDFELTALPAAEPDTGN